MSDKGTERVICIAASCLSAALLTSLFPLWDFSFLAWFALIPLLWIIQKKGGRIAFWYGWCTGFFFHYGLLYWLSGTMVRYGGLPLWLSHLFLLLLCLYMGIYIGAFALLLGYARRSVRVPFAILASVLWVGLEYLKSFLLTGFPWGLLGYSQVKAFPIIQIADLTGVYGISFLIVFVNAGITDMLAVYAAGSASVKIARQSLAIGLVLSIITGYGIWRLNASESPASKGARVSIALIQGNIPEEMKRDVTLCYEILSQYGNDSLGHIAEGKRDLVVWPENACHLSVLPGEGAAFHLLSRWAVNIGSFLVAGSPRYDQGNDGVWNSALFFSPYGDLKGFYDKIHLVPFGEYFPFDWVERMMGDIGSFSAGRECKVFEINKVNFAVIICFEAIFPDLCRRFTKRGASFLVNITNDGWFGKTAAPYQHFNMARMRAVENRVWLVRCANTGISAFVDPWGRVVKQAGIFERLALSGDIYQSQLKSPYVTMGDIFSYICLFCSLVWCIFIIRDRMKGEQRHV